MPCCKPMNSIKKMLQAPPSKSVACLQSEDCLFAFPFIMVSLLAVI